MFTGGRVLIGFYKRFVLSLSTTRLCDSNAATNVEVTCSRANLRFYLVCVARQPQTASYKHLPSFLCRPTATDRMRRSRNAPVPDKQRLWPGTPVIAVVRAKWINRSSNVYATIAIFYTFIVYIFFIPNRPTVSDRFLQRTSHSACTRGTIIVIIRTRTVLPPIPDVQSYTPMEILMSDRVLTF